MPVTDASALTAALIDVERFVGAGGWDQPTRLFALVETDAFIARDPRLATELGLRGTADGAPAGSLTSIEQDEFVAGADLGATLASIAWPDTVHGCAIAVERSFLPAAAEADLPDDPQAAAEVVASHRDHDEIRLVVGALGRHEPTTHAVVRLRSVDELLTGEDLVPGLAMALADTLTTQEATDVD